MTLEEFLIWEIQQSERHEFIGGRAAAVEIVTQQQSLLSADIISALRPLMRGTSFRLLSGVRVVVSPVGEVWYPAVVIDSGPFNPDALEPARPILAVDVCRTRVVPAHIPLAYLMVDNEGDIATARHLVSLLIREESRED